ncbi:methyltransferase [Nocardiopsis alba]|uniref:Carminomycin 4-O-methyltransferase n=1 Tax=Nocardiopsis alba TaxID=53437 RepID=A0A7K2ITL6_9ACTN|nr:methyltransferase [Nocardiopsis alba]MYR33312.1 carminomycin 4-O-methyltransferase [Nocardiopsis alba]
MDGTNARARTGEVDPREAADRLWALASPVTPMAIRAIATLRVADHLKDGPRTAAELGASVGVDPEGLARVLGYLVREGLFTRDGDRFSLTEVGAALRSDHPHSRLGWFTADGAHGRADLCLADLAEALRSGESAYSLRFDGSTFWADLSDDPALSRSFDELMASRMADLARTLVGLYDWDALEHLVDVGGGDGTLMRALLRRAPRLRGTVVDLAGPVALAGEAFRAAGVADRADAVEGDFFEPLPVHGDAYLLCWVLHDWDDDAAVEILRRCAEAAGVGGRVLVAEYGDEGRKGRGNRVSELDLRMLAYFNGRERDTRALSDLASKAGLRLVWSEEENGAALLEFTPKGE